jgi:hypothetical protein
MRLFRLYTGDDQKSHIEPLPLNFARAEFGEMAPMQPAKGFTFGRAAPGTSSDWHNAPRRQYVINLSGAVEFGLGDGSVHRLGPGDAVLVEDLTGQGHTTRIVGDEPRITVIIPLAD